MKLRIVRTPSVTGDPRYFWFTAQIKRGPFWIQCRNDFILQLNYSFQMLEDTRDMNLERVEAAVQALLEGEELYPPRDKAIVIKTYES